MTDMRALGALGLQTSRRRVAARQQVRAGNNRRDTATALAEILTDDRDAVRTVQVWGLLAWVKYTKEVDRRRIICELGCSAQAPVGSLTDRQIQTLTLELLALPPGRRQ